MQDNYSSSNEDYSTPPPVAPGTPVEQPYGYTQTNNQQTVVVVEKKSNGIGTTGFVFAILAIVLCWVPVLDLILWALGAIFSLVGVFKRPRGLALTGLIISFIGIILLIVVVGALAALSL